MAYLDTLNETQKRYIKVLSKEIPSFLLDYLETEPMKRIDTVGCGCGTDYVKMFEKKFYYTNLYHSLAVALIIWNFTHDKAQTLAGLFHDISTPALKHCVDFMNGDYEKQESTEELTTKMIAESDEIMSLLERDGLTLDQVKDYHIYPIADNGTPRLCADRLEYTFSHGYCSDSVWDIDEVEKIYENIVVLQNEEGEDELGFKNVEAAESFIKGASILWRFWVDANDKLTMQMYADLMRRMSEHGEITIEDLYKVPEKEIINRIENSKIDEVRNTFKLFKEQKQAYESDEYIENKYCRSVKSKRRYVNPLVEDSNGNAKRGKDVSELINNQIEDYLKFDTKEYLYFDFDFK